MEDIQAYIDNDQVVSVRWLANTMGSNIEKSRALMSDFKKKNDNTRASYIISGERDGSSLGFLIVMEEKVEEKKKLFNKVHSVHIYSLQRQLLEQAKLAIAIHALDQEQAENCLWNQHPNAEAFVTNMVGAVRLAGNGVTIKPPGQRAIINDKPRPASASAAAASSGSNMSGGSKNANFASKSSTTSAANFFGGSSSSGSGGAKKATPKPKAASQGKLGFGSSSSSDAPNAAAAGSEKKVVVSADDEEEEFDDGTGVKANKANLEKRNVARGMPVGEGGMHQDDVEVLNGADDEDGQTGAGGGAEGKENLAGDGKAGKGSKRKAKEASLGPVHGAMDDWREDQAIEAHNAAASDGGNKRKKKKITEKLEMDEKGYMVKRMIEEWVTDDEADAPPAPPAARPKPKQASSPIKDAPKKVKGGAKANAAAGTKSIMGFFGKK
jgi:hypothetical protein